MHNKYQKEKHELEDQWSNQQKLKALENEPKKHNSIDDCGVFFCATAEHILNDAFLEFTQADGQETHCHDFFLGKLDKKKCGSKQGQILARKLANIHVAGAGLVISKSQLKY